LELVRPEVGYYCGVKISVDGAAFFLQITTGEKDFRAYVKVRKMGGSGK
jgi:hypothetical protein